MAPAAKSAKTPVKGMQDIRSMFFSQPASSLGAKSSSLGSKAGAAIEISDDEKPMLKRKKPSALLSDDDDDAPPPKKKVAAASTTKPATASASKPKPKPKAMLSSDEDEAPKTKTSTTKPKATRKTIVSSDEDEAPKMKTSSAKPKPKAKTVVSSDEEVDPPPKKKAATSTTNGKAKAVPKKKKGDDPFEDDEDEDIEEEKPKKAKAAVKKPKKEEVAAQASGPPKPKFDWAAKAARMAAVPAAAGSKSVPEPKTPDCLMGLAFVFTGELSAFSREEAVDIAKRYGGRVTGQPSSKTSYVVLGADAGPSKLRAIEKNKLPTLNEDEFLELIATRVGPSGSGKAVDPALKKKMDKERREIEEGARELDRREKAQAREEPAGGSGKRKVEAGQQLWTQRYAPQTLKEVCGNKAQVEKLQMWLHDWPTSVKAGFKKPGKNGMNVFRAVLITGPPGIGKTTSAHLCAKLEGYTAIELNASDARSKKLVESSTNIMNKSLDGWMGGGEATNAAGIKITEQTCLIMDEVDGMSSGDRGGIGALNALIKKTKIPIICIANDRTAQKMKPLQNSTFNMTFKRPEAATVRSRILTIAHREKLKIQANVIDQLINGAQSDIRQVLNMLSTWKLSSSTMDFDEGKALAKVNEKHSVMTPYNVVSKIFGPYMFSATSRETLGDKMELYFHDHSFMPLFVQENYLKAQPARVRNMDGPPKELKQLELMDQAASSISDGDLVDAMIHGSEQHWALMPLHSVCSFVKPASLLYGSLPAYSNNPRECITFPQWLGQNSKQGKLSRQLADVQIRMRLKVSGDKGEIRQSYIPALFPHIVQPLMVDGASAVDEVIDYMDEYFINKEDWDTIVELGVGDKKDDTIMKKITPATKTSFTKKYNSKEHPIPFHKATDLGKAPKKLPGGPAPDHEDAMDNDEDVAEEEDEKKGDDDDISKDKLVKVAKPKKVKGAAANGTGAASKVKAKPKPKT